MTIIPLRWRQAQDAARNAKSLHDWREVSRSLLMDEGCVFRRNREITAWYATAYLTHPKLYKWAGMAAFASNHVRIALSPFRFDADPSGYLDIEQAVRRFRVLPANDINTIRCINNDIFDDIFWMHLAYDGGEAGLERVREALTDHPQPSSMRKIVEGMEEARQQFATGTTSESVENSVWQANQALLWLEQEQMVQPSFAKLSGAFSRMFSLGSSLHFPKEKPLCEMHLFSGFFLYMLTQEAGLLRQSRSLPKVTRLDHRWRWIQGNLLPRYRCYAQDNARMMEEMEQLLLSLERTPVCRHSAPDL